MGLVEGLDKAAVEHIAALADTPHLAVVTDFDGTLAPFAASIYEAEADPRALEALTALSTTADTMATTISQICTEGSSYDEEPANWQKVVWGLAIGIIAVVMVIFGGGQQGVDGVKYLSGVGGFCVLPIFILQLAATFKVFFIDKIIEDVDDVVDVEPEVIEEAKA